MRLGELLALLGRDLPVGKVDLVGHEHLDNLLARVFIDLQQPILNIVERLLLVDIIYKYNTHRALIVCLRNCSKPLLTGRIPHL